MTQRLIAIVIGLSLLFYCEVRADENKFFIHDASGQLVGVVLGDGSAVIYSYGRAGERTHRRVLQASSNSISAIMPAQIIAGTSVSVVVSGSGLASTEAIVFNTPGLIVKNVAVLSDKLLKASLVVDSTVSPGAYSFRVLRSIGSAIESGPVAFIVTGGPTLTSLAPGEVSQGQTIGTWTLSGFQLSSATNVLFDITGVTASGLAISPDGTSLTARLDISRATPLGTTGVRVQTAAGISNRVHLQIKPGTQLLQYGETLARGTDAPGEVDYYSFNGTAGDAILARVTYSVFGSPKVRILRPDGTQLCSDQADVTIEDLCTLDASGQYTLSVEDWRGVASGNYGLHLQRINGPGNSTQTAFGNTLSGSIDFTAELDAYTFIASAGDKIIAKMGLTSSNLPFSPKLRIFRPNGSVLCSAESGANVPLMELACTLDVVGTYTLITGDRVGTGRSGYGLYLQKINGPVGARPIGFGDTVSGTINVPAKTDTYTISANSGDTLLIKMARTSGFDLGPKIRVYRPDGSQVCVGDGSSPSESFCVLDASGIHTILAADSRGPWLGSYGLHLQRTNAPSQATPITFGETLTASLDSLAELDAYTFTASAGDMVFARMGLSVSNSPFSPMLRIFRSDGSQLCLAQSNGFVPLMELLCRLDVSGTYTLITGDRLGAGQGGYGIHLQRTNAPGGALPINFGDTVTGVIDVPGKAIAYTVAANSGDSLLIKMARTLGFDLDPKVVVYRQDGSQVCVISNGLNPAEIFCVLDASGVYTVLTADSHGPGLGNYGLYLQRTNAPGQATPIAFGDTLTASLDSVAELDAYIFTASAGDTVFARMSLPSANLQFSPMLRIYRPNGSQLCLAQSNSLPPAIELLCPLDATGTYTLISGERFGIGQGGYGIHLQRTNAPGGAASIHFGDTLTGAIGAVAEFDAYVFSGTAGNSARVTMTRTAGTLGPSFRVYQPDGTALCSAANSNLAQALCTLNATGNYVILAGDGSGNTTGSYSLSLQPN